MNKIETTVREAVVVRQVPAPAGGSSVEVKIRRRHSFTQDADRSAPSDVQDLTEITITRKNDSETWRLPVINIETLRVLAAAIDDVLEQRLDLGLRKRQHEAEAPGPGPL